LINFKCVVAIAVILYIYFIFKLVRYLEKNKIMKQILANVSLFVLGKHISVYGLIDSGNSLRDPITRKPVVLISIASLMKFISGDELKKIKELYCYNLRCETVTDKDVVIPIFKCSNMKIKTAERTQSITCMVGLVDNVFENGKYDCLLPRDLL
jgi:stage II sporulation protein GA (sporulation sigma-E factor processing peptidase)